jgi:serine protease Do
MTKMIKIKKIFGVHFYLGLLFFFSSIPPMPISAEPSVEKVHMEKDHRETPSLKNTYTSSLASVVEKVLPSVVSIFAEKIVQKRSFSLFDDPFFHFFLEGNNLGAVPQERLAQSLGSGAIVHEKGYIITCHHVIKGADNIRVILNDQREYEAGIVLEDPDEDLAVLRIKSKEGERFPYLAFSSLQHDQVGDRVIACGNPFGINMTVTAGIISANNTVIQNSVLLQTDAALNPGNSGGVLVNEEGKIVGIPNAIFSRSGGSHGVNFAIPAPLASSLVQAAVRGEKLKRSWSGLKVHSLDQKMVEALGGNIRQGVLVRDIHPKSPAIEADIRVGDVILSLNNQPVVSEEAFRYSLKVTPSGTVVPVHLYRRGNHYKGAFRLIEPPEDPASMRTVLDNYGFLTGIELANLSPAIVEEMGHGYLLPKKGVVVTRVDERYRQSDFVFDVGDVLLSLNGKAVTSVQDVLNLKAQKKRLLSVILQRGAQRIQFEQRS